MTPEQAELLRRACIVFDAYLEEGQIAGLSALATELPDLKTGAGAMLIATIAMGTLLREYWGSENISTAL